MLDPRDQAFLAAAVRAGAVPAAQAAELASRYRGPPGALDEALVRADVLDPATRDALRPQVAGAPPPASTPSAPTPGSAPPPGSDTPGATHAAGSSSGPAAGRRRTTGRLSQLFGVPAIPGYQLGAVLGRGGMGVVYRAVEEATGQPVAVKVLLADGERRVARFEREAEALKRLQHVGIVDLLASGEVEGKPYLVMPCVEGGDLATALEEGRLGERESLAVVAKVARAVAHAHALGVLHRDLKPGNVLLEADGTPRVTDFGLARVLDRETRLTRTADMLGTPAYMSPEQVKSQELTRAVDVYALGVMIYQVVSGHLPFEGSGGAILDAIVRQPAPPLPGAPPDLTRLVGWCLEKAPTDRPSALHVAELLEAHLRGDRLALATPTARRRRRAVAAAALAGALALAGAGGAWFVLATLRGGEAALAELKEALDRARASRGRQTVEGLLKETELHREAAAAFAAVPTPRRPEAEDLYGWARARRAEVLSEAAARLAEEGRVADAVALARERLEAEPSAEARVVLARLLAEQPETTAEAVALAREVGSGGLTPPLSEELARLLLRVHRPRLAAAALADAPPALRGLRARAREAAGDLAGARADLAALVAEGARDVGLHLRLARLDGALGDAAEGLGRLEALDAGGRADFHAARAELLAAVGRPGAAGSAWEQAIGLDPRQRLGRATFFLARSRPRTALLDLEALAPDLEAGLVGGLTRWLLGAPDAELEAAVAAVVAACEAHEATPRLAAAALAWRARLELARGSPGAALEAARRARALDPPAGAALEGWVLLRDRRPSDAAAVLLEADPALAQVALAEARLEAGDLAEAEALLAALPPSAPRADLALRLARRRGGRPNELRGLEERAWAARAVEPAPPFPLATRPRGLDAAWAAAHLFREARRLDALRDTKAEGVAARATLLLERCLALDPGHVPAQLLLGRLADRPDAIEAAAAEHPHLLPAQRAHLLLLARVTGSAELSRDLARPILQLMAPHPSLTVEERVLCAQLFAGDGRLGEARTALLPALEVLPRHEEAHRLGLALARQLGDQVWAEQLERALAERAESEAQADSLWAQTSFQEDIRRLPTVKAAVARIGRDLDRGARYWHRRADSAFGEGALAKSVVSAGEYVLRASGMPAHRLHEWTWDYGWTPLAPPRQVEELTAQPIAARPDDPAPYLARAIGAFARHHLAQPPDPEDLERAAAWALHAADLAPASPGAQAFAADVLLEGGHVGEAAELARAALFLDDRSQYAAFQLARVAAAQGRADVAVSMLERSGVPNESPRWSFEADPAFAPILQDPVFEAYWAAQPR